TTSSSHLSSSRTGFPKPSPGLDAALHALDGGNKLARDAGLAHRMSGVGHDDEFGLGPGARQRVGGDRRTDDVVAALDDRARQMTDAGEIVEQLTVREKALVDEIVRFDSRDREGGHIVVVAGD